jgi:hypothetical protein
MLITLAGLPRSGTAFCSTLLSLNRDCIAYHELANYDRGWRHTLLTSRFRYVADCSTYGFLKEAELPSDKRIFLTHDVKISHERAELACLKAIHPSLIPRFKAAGEEWAEIYDALTLSKEEVFTVDGCFRIWTYCFTESFPDEKVQQLLKLNIQHHNAHIIFGKNSNFVL